VTVIGLAVIGLWDASALDRPVEHLFGNAHGFVWKENWYLAHVLHDQAKKLSWLVLLGLVLMIRWPLGGLRRLSVRERGEMVVAIVLAVLTVSLLKQLSATSCPWSLKEFGGVRDYISHWDWQLREPGGGQCFPAGHATSGFAFMAGWFWLRDASPRLATHWLAVALLAGGLLGAAQQVRGAHFTSHTLWSAWICWTVSWLFWEACRRLDRSAREVAAGQRGSAHADGRGRHRHDAREELFVGRTGHVLASERVLVFRERGVELLPVGFGELGLGLGQDGLFFQAHVIHVEVQVAPRRVDERLLAAVSQELPGDEFVHQFAHRDLTLEVVTLQPRDGIHQRGCAPRDAGEQQARLLGMVQPLGKFVDVEKHRAQHLEEARRIVLRAALNHLAHGQQHGRQRGVLVSDHTQGEMRGGHGFSVQATDPRACPRGAAPAMTWVKRRRCRAASSA